MRRLMSWPASAPMLQFIRLLNPSSSRLIHWCPLFLRFSATGRKFSSPRRIRKTVFCKRIPKAPAMNKRQQIQQLIQLGTSAKGHSWEIKSQHPTNLTATCTKCGLWIQQVDPGPLFQQVLAQPCMGFEGTPPQHLATHPSHQLVSIGKGWQCKVCEGILVARAKQVPKLLLGVCAKRKGTSAISKFTKGLLSGAAAPKSLPLSKKMGKKA